MHPYVKFEGLTDDDDAQLASIREAAEAWLTLIYGIMRKQMELAIRFNNGKAGISEEAAADYWPCCTGKLAESAIHPDLLPSLLPHLRTYGWPGESVSTMPIRVAFRLTEPEADDGYRMAS